MKLLYTILLYLTFLTGFSQDDKSPYLLVSTENVVIPLKSSKTDVEISGTIAHVRVTQVYQNEGSQTIEAKYVFPLSAQAAVHKMQMTIDNRIVNAKIYEKQEAQKVYKKALDDIIRCESESNNTIFYLQDKRKIFVTKTLKYLEDLLSSHDFVRVHQSHLVNLQCISAYIKTDGGYLMLKNGENVPVSVRKKTEIIEILDKMYR
ncbi:VIT domain-containing protein [Maribacter arcticus]|uniref:VIT domain-containing protein n=1 Tax=Maribacter arcticus TaxID=561365 RepID=UPI0030039258